LPDERPYSRDFVNSVARALRVIQCFDERSPVLTLSEVAARAELTRATARRLLLTLAELGFVSFDGGREFALTPRVLDLGYSYLSSMGFADIARPFIQEASRKANESCSISVLSGDDIVYVSRIHTERIMSISLAIGSHLPAVVTSMGRVLLAHLEDEELDRRLPEMELKRFTPRTVTSPRRLRTLLAGVREHGYAIVEGELEIGLSSIAVPLYAEGGDVIAAINFGGAAARLQGAALTRRYLPILRETSSLITHALSRSGRSSPDRSS